MPAKKKKFINKNESVTFHLVHRSQKDPLIVDEKSSQHVLVESGGNQPEKKKKEEQRKYGVFYEDDYDYLQHLRERDEVYELEPVDRSNMQQDKQKQNSKISLPSSVFPSDYEKPVGLLNQLPARGPQPSWDPDIVEALDDDYDFDDPDNQLDDDFVMKAQESGGEDIDCDKEYEEGSDLENVSDLDSNEAMTDDEFDPDYVYGDNMFMDEETKSRFTAYSMSSSVIRRNEGLTLLDDRFEKLYEEYDDEEIGALDDNEIDGKMKQENEMFQNIVAEFEKEQKRRTLKEVVDNAVEGDEDILSDASDESDTEIIQVEVKPEEKWDCESFLSTYSNLYNHPKLISEPKKVKPVRLAGRHGLPEESIAVRGLTEKEIEAEFGRERSDRASTYRPKDETITEKSQRKKAVKEERRERRQEKKANKLAFKKEQLRQDKEVVNINKNLTSVKIV